MQPVCHFTPLGPGPCARPVVGSPFHAAAELGPHRRSKALATGPTALRTALHSLPGPGSGLPALPRSSPKRWGRGAAGSTPAACPRPWGLPRAAADCPGRTRPPPPRFPAVPRGASRPAAGTAPARTECCSGSSRSCEGTGVALVKAAGTPLAWHPTASCASPHLPQPFPPVTPAPGVRWRHPAREQRASRKSSAASHRGSRLHAAPEAGQPCVPPCGGPGPLSSPAAREQTALTPGPFVPKSDDVGSGPWSGAGRRRSQPHAARPRASNTHSLETSSRWRWMFFCRNCTAGSSVPALEDRPPQRSAATGAPRASPCGPGPPRRVRRLRVTVCVDEEQR